MTWTEPDYRVRCRDCQRMERDRLRGPVCRDSGHPRFTMIGREFERAPMAEKSHGYPPRMGTDPDRLRNCQSFKGLRA